MQEENPNGTTVFLLGWLSKTGLISFSKLSKEKHLSINIKKQEMKIFRYRDYIEKLNFHQDLLFELQTHFS